MVLLAGNSHPDLADLVARHLDSRLGNSSVSMQATKWLKCRQIYSNNQDFLVPRLCLQFAVIFDLGLSQDKSRDNGRDKRVC